MTPPENPDASALLEPDEIRRALEGLRPDPEEFRRGIERRIAEREAEDDDQRARFAAAPERLRWAAAILPPGVISGAAAAAGVAGKKVGLKAVPGLMAIPAIATLMVLLTFFGAMRAMKPAEGLAGERVASEKEALVAWWKRHRVATWITFAVLALLVILRHSEVVMVFLAISMVAMTLQLGALGRAGFGDRERFGKLTGQFLFWTAYLWYMLRSGPGGIDSLVGTSLLCLGGVICFTVGGSMTPRMLWDRIWHPERRMLYPDPITTFCLRGLYSFFALGATALLVVVAATNVAALVSLSSPRARLIDWAEGFEEPVDEAIHWERFDRVARFLASAGGELPDLDRPQSVVWRALEAGWELDPRILAAVLSESGPVPPAKAVERLSPDHRRWLLGGTSAIGFHRDPAVLRILVGAGALSSAEIESLIARLEASWPEPDKFQALEEQRILLELCALLGAGDLAAAHAGDVRESLRLLWRGTYDESTPAFFAKDLERAAEEPSFALRYRREIKSWQVEPTQAAIELMTRYGAPGEIDLGRLRDDLATPQVPMWLTAWRYTSTDALADLARAQLEELAPSEPWNPLSALVRRRVLLGVLLLVVLCVVATARAPRREVSA